jgi:GDP-D-mannose dehydratase
MSLHLGDLQDPPTLLSRLQADEVNSLGVQSRMRVSLDVPDYIDDLVGLGAVQPLEAIHSVALEAGFY